MRMLAILLALIAGGKVLTLEWLHRTASDEAIVAAYAPRALDACTRDARHRALPVEPSGWASTSAMHVEIGRRDSGVALWQVDDPAWIKRFRSPYLHLIASTAGHTFDCAFDVLAGTAVARKL